MSEAQTFEFESARVLGQLFLNDLGNLRAVEEALGVKITTREGWLRVEGSGEDVAAAGKMFRQLDDARKAGLSIRRYEFNYALRSVRDPEAVGLDSLVITRIQCSPRRPPIIPKNPVQRAYIQAIQQHDMTFGIGPAGTGKTYLAMAMAISALKKEEVHRIILTRPAVEAGEALGFLPGDLNEKIMPYLRPLYDALHDMLESDEIQRYFERGVIEVAPLAYMRGRTLNRAFVVLDEAQNTTTEQMFMFLTRLGAESKAVITGDPTQIDLPPNKRSGMVEALGALRDIEGIAFAQFGDRDVIRHELVQRIVTAYREHRGTAVKK
jgi:phosphate starvation-inducible protein PhoH and related proteins